MRLAHANTAQNCVAAGIPGTTAAVRPAGVSKEVVDHCERAVLEAWHGDGEYGRAQPSADKSNPGSVQQCTLLKFAVEEGRPTRLVVRAGDWGWHSGESSEAGTLWGCTFLQLCGVSDTLTRRTGTAHTTAKLADDVRLLLFLVPVICLCSPRLISSQCQSHCVVVSFWTQNVGVQPQNLEHLQPPSTSPCSRLSDPCLSQGSGCRLLLLCAQCVRLPPTLIPFCNLLPPTLQLWRILHA